MTYSTTQTLDTGEAYFSSLGIVGGATGMSPILTHPVSAVVPDGYKSVTSVTADESVVTQTANSDDYMNYNLLDSGDTSYSKVLAIAYGTASNYNYWTMVLSENEYTGAVVGSYMTDLYQFRGDGLFYSNNGVSWVNFASDQTILEETGATAPIRGMAMYIEGSNNIQKVWVRSGGEEQWIQIISTTDSATGSSGFKSLGFYTYAAIKRVVCPVMAWGVV